jgi:uncharacterized protein (TIGR00251 family)
MGWRLIPRSLQVGFSQKFNYHGYTVCYLQVHRLFELLTRIVVIPRNSSMTAVKLELKIIPGAAQEQVVGMLGDALKIRVRAQPERGKANAAVIAILAKFFELPEAALTICSGHTSASKVVEIQGLSRADLDHKLND